MEDTFKPKLNSKVRPKDTDVQRLKLPSMAIKA